MASIAKANPGDPDDAHPVGRSPPRREDRRLLRGGASFVADIALEGALHVGFVRSPVASGHITGCDLEDALACPGVIAAFHGSHVAYLADLSVNAVLGPVDAMDYPVLAADHLLAVGQPVAAVLAQSAPMAQDACEMVDVDFGAAQNGPTIDPADEDAGVPFSRHWRQGEPEEAFEQADHCVEVEVQHPRLAPSPMENRAIAVRFEPDDRGVTVWLSTQTPHRARTELARILNRDAAKIRVIAPDTGGAFGLKASLYPEEVFAVWAAFELRRSVRWTATRNEDLLSAAHGRGLTTQGRLALSEDGVFLGLQAHIRAPVGCWLTSSSAIPAWNAARILPGPYEIPAFDLQTCGVRTNTAPVGIYRGAGRPEAAMLMERLVEEAARRIGIDPMELRRINLLSAVDLPCRRTTGIMLDSGDYKQALAVLETSAAYGQARKQQKQRRARGEIVGIGAGFFVEPCGAGWESASVALNPDGTVLVHSGGSAQGHGRETAFAQIAAQELGCDMDRVTVRFGDTKDCPNGIGALASRSTAIGGSAVVKAAREALVKSGGTLAPKQPVEASVRYEAEGEAWGYGCYLAQLSIDPETGVITVERLICLDDAGVIINPRLAEGQIRGGIAQGVGEALLERLVYDDDGQLITGSLMDYALPRADDMPKVEIVHMETPSPANLLGAKGIGEAGTIGAPAAIYNAAYDALAPLGVTSLPLPLTGQAIWRAIRSAANESDGNRNR